MQTNLSVFSKSFLNFDFLSSEVEFNIRLIPSIFFSASSSIKEIILSDALFIKITLFFSKNEFVEILS